VALLALPQVATADGTYRTERLEFAPVAGAPLRSGFVVNAHANSPGVYANERYVLTGALPHETYQVTLVVFPGDPTCAGDGLALDTATLETNAAGNGEARARFTLEGVPPEWRGTTIGGLWQISLDGVVRYATACTAIALD
jgi:hypothetical protein